MKREAATLNGWGLLNKNLENGTKKANSTLSRRSEITEDTGWMTFRREDMLTLMSSFSNKLYGKRSAEMKKQRKLAKLAATNAAAIPAATGEAHEAMAVS